MCYVLTKATDIEAKVFEKEGLEKMLDECMKAVLKERAMPRSASSINIGTMVHEVKITPTGTFLYGPEPEGNNRVLRKYSKYHDYFLRVHFCDEDGEPVRFHPKASNDEIYNYRFKHVLDHGLIIAGRKYEVLAGSHSSMRAQATWFMAGFTLDNEKTLTARGVIGGLGNFTAIRSPAKCAARIGQAFSDTFLAISFPSTIKKEIPDVERNGYTFSDGVGTISQSVAHTIQEKLPKGEGPKPTIFQVRIEGM